MSQAIGARSTAKKKGAKDAGAKRRQQQKRMQVADGLLDTILCCLNAHLHQLTAHPLDDTMQCIVKEIARYRAESATWH